MGLKFLTAGESHGSALIVILDGFPAGMPLAPTDFSLDLGRRQIGCGSGQRMKIEHDSVRIISGVMEGITIGAPIALHISNKDHEKWQNTSIPPFTVPRPGHADLAGAIKFGNSDLRPISERASARETASRVAVGAICRKFLSLFDISIAGWVSSIGAINSDLSTLSIADCINQAAISKVKCPDTSASESMQTAINLAAKSGDTLGGIIEIAILGVPPGLGSFSQWDSRLDSRLGAVILSVPGIKGIEIGEAFMNTKLPGTQVQDEILLKPNGFLSRSTNHAGGIEGGISNGEPILLRAAMKPIPTTCSPQKSVDLSSGECKQTIYERSDTCAVPRAVVILESMAAFTIADALINKIGGDSVDEMLPRYKSIRQTRLQDLHLSNKEHIFWPED